VKAFNQRKLAMTITVSATTKALGKKSGKAAAILIRQTIKTKGYAHIILATGTSQFETLNNLIADTRIDWSKVTMFHLDEYVGLPDTHPASFRKYLKDRFLAQVPPLKAYHLINAETNPAAECARLSQLIAAHPIDVTLCGIGENGHLAFNDPPADFDTETPYLVVELDEACRKQQFGEGWFPSFDAVPTQAISMSIQQIMKSKHIICSVPDTRKAQAVKDCLNGVVSNVYPASILQNHPNCTVYLDKASASLR
jgi:glucosamine-6-phosphate deaminase